MALSGQFLDNFDPFDPRLQKNPTKTSLLMLMFDIITTLKLYDIGTFFTIPSELVFDNP